jgi:hypothetical protein
MKYTLIPEIIELSDTNINSINVNITAKFFKHLVDSIDANL